MRVVYKNKLSELDKLARDLKDFCDRKSLDSKCLHDLNLCLDEVFTNIVSYGFLDQDEHSITVILSHDKEYITIVVEDSGVPFNPILEAPDPNIASSSSDLSSYIPGGLGLHFVKQMMDKLEYERRGDLNIFKMIMLL